MLKLFNKAYSVLESTAIRPIATTMKEKQGEDVEDPNHIIRQGLLVVVLFFGSLIMWAVFGEISGAVVAPGTIKIDTQRKTVQHLEGGIIDSIMVREGDEVKEGQTLIVLESVQVDASTEMLQKQLVAQQAAHCRAQVEKELGSELSWPDDLIELARISHSEDVLENEKINFAVRRDALNGQISLLKSQISQLKSQIAGYEDQIRAEAAIIATLNEELGAKRQLVKERYLDKSHILELERNLASHQGQRGRMRQAVAEAKQRISESNLRMKDLQNRFIEAASGESGRLQNEILQLQERIRPLEDARKRLSVTAPVSGRVVDLKVHSKGGVVRSGEPLMDIVPTDTPMIAEVQVPVNKITEVYSGQEALVQMDAFDTRLVPHIAATVRHVSADRLEDRTGMGVMPYYLCYVEIDPEALKKEDVYITPGMPVTVFITTRKTSVIYYMLEPLIKSWERSLRE